MRITDARVVDPHPRNGDITFAVGESFRSDGIWRHEQEDDERPQDGNAAGDNIHVAPGRERASDVAKAIVDKWRNNGDVAGHGVPDAHAEGLFLLFVPSRKIV